MPVPSQYYGGGPQSDLWLGPNYTDYILEGNLDEAFTASGTALMAAMLFRIQFSSPRSGYLFAFPPGERNQELLLNGPFPAGEYKDGTIVRTIYDSGDNRYYQDWILQVADLDDASSQAPWLVQFYYDHNIMGTQTFFDKVGWWMPYTDLESEQLGASNMGIGSKTGNGFPSQTGSG